VYTTSARPLDERILQEGMVIAIEPFLSTKSRNVTEASDGWTLTGAVGNISARYKHAMIITKSASIVVAVLKFSWTCPSCRRTHQKWKSGAEFIDAFGVYGS
jgi:hypothetical protein